MLEIKSTTRSSKAKNEALAEVVKEKTSRLNANIPESLYRELKVKAAQHDEKINDLVVLWVSEYLSK